MHSIQRMGYLLRRDVVESYKPAALVCAAFAGVYLVVSLLACIFGPPAPPVGPLNMTGHEILFVLILYIGGAIVASRTFAEVHNRTKNHEWFMLPAATHEKFVTRLLLSMAGYTVVVLVGYFLTTAITSGVTVVFTKCHPGIFNPFSREVWRAIGHFWIFQSVFLFGAAFFRKNHLVKTVLSAMLIALIVTVFTSVVLRIVFSGYFHGFEPTAEFSRLFEDFGNRITWFDRHNGFIRALRIGGEVVYWGLVAPLFWILAYFRLREAEVSHGV